MESYYKIAGLTVKLESFGRTMEQAEPYRCEPCEAVDAEVSTKGFDLERLVPGETPDLQEYLISGAVFYRELIRFGGMMLHSSAVVVDGKAYLFTANPGVGKSTHTGLWVEQFKDRDAYVLNDDKPAIRFQDGTWYAYGTPWSGKHDISRNIGVPLAGIAVLERGETNEIQRFSGPEAIRALLKQMNRPGIAEIRIRLMALINELFTHVPIWKLRCTIDPEAVKVAYEAMSGKKIDA